MKTMITKSVIRLMAAAASSVCLISTPVAAAQVKPEMTGMAPAATQNVLGQVCAAGLDTIQPKMKNDAAAAVVKTGIADINGKTYYLDSLGKPVSGIVTLEDGDHFFSAEDGEQTGFISDEGNTYYFDKETGVKAEGTIEVEGKTYVLGENGETRKGWVEENGNKLYLNEDGSVVENEAREIDGIRYSFNDQGQLEKNITKDGFIYNEKGEGTPDMSGYDKIAQAALAQVGVMQDCTMLVTNALKAVGINHHGWPDSYLSLGPLTSNPVPGDVIVYTGHVAIYIGDGKAVHGGWLGNQTVVTTVECDKPLVGFVHPILP